jgi:hypothetical protein
MSGVVTTYCMSCGKPQSDKDRELKALRRIAGLKMVREGVREARFGTFEMDMAMPAETRFDSIGNATLTVQS